MFYFALILAISIDIISKLLAEAYLVEKVKILWDNFWLNLIYNSWIAFSLPLEWIILKIITVILIALLAVYYFSSERKYKHKLIDIGFWLLLWWAIWNWFERLFYWYVTDFISLKYFAIFNFGDIFINVWVILVFISYLVQKWKKKC